MISPSGRRSTGSPSSAGVEAGPPEGVVAACDTARDSSALFSAAGIDRPGSSAASVLPGVVTGPACAGAGPSGAGPAGVDGVEPEPAGRPAPAPVEDKPVIIPPP